MLSSFLDAMLISFQDDVTAKTIPIRLHHTVRAESLIIRNQHLLKTSAGRKINELKYNVKHRPDTKVHFLKKCIICKEM